MSKRNRKGTAAAPAFDSEESEENGTETVETVDEIVESANDGAEEVTEVVDEIGEVTEVTESEAETVAAVKTKPVKTVKVRVPRVAVFEIGDAVAYTVQQDGAKMRFGVVEGIDEKITVRTLSGRLIEREPHYNLIVKVEGAPQDYADEIKELSIDL